MSRFFVEFSHAPILNLNDCSRQKIAPRPVFHNCGMGFQPFLKGDYEKNGFADYHCN